MPERRASGRPGEGVDRSTRLAFRFDGRAHPGFEGDTIGSALAADGVRVLARSFKYHRPRGLLCCAGRCPNCLVEVDGVPNQRACVTPLRNGMDVRPQNTRPSLRWDLLSLNGRLDRLLPSGFYYKTFIRPRRLWPLYERVLRAAAGLGRVRADAPPLHARTRHLHVDVTVVGGGPAGCLAALEAAAAGARVVLVDDAPRLGGHLRWRTRPVTSDDPRLAGATAGAAADRLARLVADEPGIEHLASATALGLYEGGLVAVRQGETLLRVRTRHVVVAAGAQERPALFDRNDLPGIMLASGVLRLAHGYGVLAGRRAVVVTDDDHGWWAASDLLDAGIAVAALVDARPAPGPDVPRARLEAAPGLALHLAARPVKATGTGSVSALTVAGPSGQHTIDGDLVAMAMRPEPVVSLLAGAGARTAWDPRTDRYVPTSLPEGVEAAGHVLGDADDRLLVAGGIAAGRAAAVAAGRPGVPSAAAEFETLDALRAALLAATPEPAPFEVTGGRKQFVCVCEDVTVKELSESYYEGFTDLETLKRYSTVTMGPCQGRMCHGLSARLHARLSDASPADTPLTTARPPFQPVPLGVLAGPHHAIVRRTAMHDQHAALGATWTDMGDWKRALHYGDVTAEVRAVREAAGLIDVSTLGKIEVQGPDAGAFLDWLHPNRFSDLRVGRLRYRAMLDDAGIILDDGTVARLGPERFLVTTTTGTIDAVEQWFRWWDAGSERDVSVVNVTSALAAVNLAGPRAREILARACDADLSAAALPYLAAAEATVAGIPAILLRMGFVGELAFEIHVPADRGAALWDALLAAGADLGLRPFGVEAQRVLRLEKGHAIVGQDTDALSTPADAGMGWLVKADKPDFIGRDAILGLRDDRPGRLVLTGFSVPGPDLPAEGAAIVRGGHAVGRVTSSKASPTLGHPIGLAWVPAEDAVDGTPLTIRLGVGTAGTTVRGTVHTGPFYDAAGERLRS